MMSALEMNQEEKGAGGFPKYTHIFNNKLNSIVFCYIIQSFKFKALCEQPSLKELLQSKWKSRLNKVNEAFK